jgi:Phage integrase, N-terminal SAM-like domain
MPQLDLRKWAFGPDESYSLDPVTRFYEALFRLERAASEAGLDANARLGTEAPPQKKRGRSMSRRGGQRGTVVERHGRYVGRYYVDSPDSAVGHRRAIVLGKTDKMTKSEARRRLLGPITSEGVNEPFVEAPPKSGTFNAAADNWERVRLPKLSLSTQYLAPKLIAKHLRPFFGQMALDAIKTGTINEWLATLPELEPKTVHNLYKLFRAIVSWSYRQKDQQPPKWSPDLPPLKDDEQRWFTPEECRKLVFAATG